MENSDRLSVRGSAFNNTRRLLSLAREASPKSVRVSYFLFLNFPYRDPDFPLARENKAGKIELIGG